MCLEVCFYACFLECYQANENNHVNPSDKISVDILIDSAKGAHNKSQAKLYDVFESLIQALKSSYRSQALRVECMMVHNSRHHPFLQDNQTLLIPIKAKLR